MPRVSVMQTDELGRVLIQVRIPRALVKQVDHAAIELNCDRAGAVAYLLERGLERVGYRDPIHRAVEPDA